jgi:hypothetical protein
VEARTPAEVEEVLAILTADAAGCGITRLMLDNMTTTTVGGVDDRTGETTTTTVDVSALAAAMALIRACPAAAGLETEASGGVTVTRLAGDREGKGEGGKGDGDGGEGGGRRRGKGDGGKSDGDFAIWSKMV